MSVTLPSGCHWATPEEWEQRRETITDLYEKQKLSEVMSIMRGKYMFFATVKMFKTHFTRWGIQKNFRAGQVADLLRQKHDRDAACKRSKMYIRGKPVDPERLKSYLNRTVGAQKELLVSAETEERLLSDATEDSLSSNVVSCRSPSPPSPSFPNEQISPSPVKGHHTLPSFNKSNKRQTIRVVSSTPSITCLAAPDHLNRAEQCLMTMRRYLFWELSRSNWEGPTCQDDLEAGNDCEDWEARFIDVARYLDIGHTTRGFRLLQACFNQLQQLITLNSIKWIPAVLSTLVYMERYHGISQALKRQLHDLYTIQFGTSHPFSKFFTLLCCMDHEEISSIWRAITDCQFDVLETHIGVHNDWLGLISMYRLEVYYDLAMESKLDWVTVESLAINTLEGDKPTDWSLFATVSTKKFLATCLQKRYKYNESRAMYLDILRENIRDPFFLESEWPEIICIHLLEVAYELKNIQEAEYYATKAAEYCKSSSIDSQIYVLGWTRWLYSNLENDEMVSKVDMDVERSIDLLSAQFEEVDLVDQPHVY